MEHIEHEILRSVILRPLSSFNEIVHAVFNTVETAPQEGLMLEMISNSKAIIDPTRPKAPKEGAGLFCGCFGGGGQTKEQNSEVTASSTPEKENIGEVFKAR